MTNSTFNSKHHLLVSSQHHQVKTLAIFHNFWMKMLPTFCCPDSSLQFYFLHFTETAGLNLLNMTKGDVFTKKQPSG